MRTVVQISLEAAALGVLRGHDALPRGAQFVRLIRNLRETGLQLDVQSHTVDGRARLRSEIRQQALLRPGEGLA